jgi:hypothetical protein
VILILPVLKVWQALTTMELSRIMRSVLVKKLFALEKSAVSDAKLTGAIDWEQKERLAASVRSQGIDPDLIRALKWGSQ